MRRRSFLVFVFALPMLLAVSRWLDAAPAPAGPPSVLVKTGLGDLSIRLDWANSPENCAAFVRYIHDGIYAHTSFDDMDKFCLYGGKPSMRFPHLAMNGNMLAADGPAGEFKLRNRLGAVGFRRTTGDCNPAKRSNCTQIYLMLTDHPEADGEFTIFGAVESGPAVVAAVRAKLAGHEPVPFTVEIPDGTVAANVPASADR